MPRRKSTVLGYYIPSFFEMHVNTYQKDMTINKLPLKDMTTLFHEYIHYLQDFTTYYGLNGLYVHSEYIHSVVNRIYDLGTNSVKVPFVINDNDDNLLLNQTIRRFTEGDSAEISKLSILDIREDKDKLFKNPYKREIPNVIINPTTDMVVFGATAITENMAYLMERLCSPKGFVKSPEFPYMAAEKVADYYVPGFSNDSLMVLALCDMSLMSSNPGENYVRVMKSIKDGSLSFSKPEDIYDHFYSQTASFADGRTPCDLLSSFKSLLSNVESLLKSYIRNMPITKFYYEWIERLVNFAIEWRENDRYFLLNMARHNDLATNNYFGKAVHDVGTPLMSNNNPGEYFKVNPNGLSVEMNVEYFKAFQEIENTFMLASRSCSLYEWCKSSPNATPNNLFLTSPWKKCNEQRLCPYALLWKHWNLTGKEPVK